MTTATPPPKIKAATYIGAVCKRGHDGERFRSDGSCVQCRHLTSEKWYNHNKDRKLATGKLWASQNLEKVRAKYRTYALRHPEKIKLKESKRQNRPERARQYRIENPDSAAKAAKKWRAKYPEKVRASWRNQRARRRSVRGRHNALDVSQIYLAQKGRCAYCLKSLRESYHVDHIIPLTKNGTNDRRNLQLTCRSCNQKKYNHDPIDFARRIGRLL